LDGGGIRFLEVHIKILEGRDLVPKDKNIWGRKVSSDPYVKIYHGLSRVGRTDICFKTLNPQWETSNQFQLRVLPQALDSFPTIDCQIWDHDHLSSDDSMGVCYVPVPTSLNRRETKWIPVQRGGKPGDDTYCRNATGALKVEVEVRSKLSRGFQNELCKTASQRGGFSLD
jgi:Ca2+-dependent lipid-binding protein